MQAHGVSVISLIVIWIIRKIWDTESCIYVFLLLKSAWTSACRRIKSHKITANVVDVEFKLYNDKQFPISHMTIYYAKWIACDYCWAAIVINIIRFILCGSSLQIRRGLSILFISLRGLQKHRVWKSPMSMLLCPI